MSNECNVVRIHLKTDTDNREELIEFCLHNEETQFVAIGWSCVYKDYSINSFEDYYNAVKDWSLKRRKKNGGGYRINPAINKFYDTKENDLFWTRDTDGIYWICRAKGKAEHYYDASLDIGAVIPVEAHKVGIEVPGQIKASFSRPRGGISESFNKDNLIITFSQYIFNKLTKEKIYTVSPPEHENILDNLPPLDLEELVISYIQIKEDYYLLSNSIAKNSTTMKIECEFISRHKNDPKRAVVQVKGKGSEGLNALDFKDYVDDGFIVYLFAPKVYNIEKMPNIVKIEDQDLTEFYQEYKSILPDSVTMWESIFN